MKKLAVMTIVIALLLGIASIVNAATEKVTFELGEEMRSGDYTIEYDTEYLKFKSVTPANSSNETTAGTVKGAFFSEKTETVTVEFEVIKEVEAGKEVKANVTFIPGEFTNTNKEIAEVKGSTKEVALKSSPTPTPTVTETKAPEVTETPKATETKAPEATTTPTPKATEKASSSSDEPEGYDPTGASIAFVGVIAVIVMAGTAVLIKRK